MTREEIEAAKAALAADDPSYFTRDVVEALLNDVVRLRAVLASANTQRAGPPPRRLPAPPCRRCGSTDTYTDAIEVPMSGDVPPYPVIAGESHCRRCETSIAERPGS